MNSDQRKQNLRMAMRRRRQVSSEAPEASYALVERLAALLLSLSSVQKIGAVWPLPGEVDLRPLCYLLHDAGRDILLPETTPKGQPLIFRRWTPVCALLSGRFNTVHPDGPVDLPDLVLVPLLAFDRSLNRLGYGGGYYDRTLAVLRCRAIGFAYSWQEVEQVPLGLYDQPLTQIVTEHEIIERQVEEGETG